MGAKVGTGEVSNMSAEELGFVAAVCAEPDEDTRRLAYADWLQEHGEESRAEFIRVQIGIARFQPVVRDAPIYALEHEIAREQKHRDTFRDPRLKAYFDEMVDAVEKKKRLHDLWAAYGDRFSPELTGLLCRTPPSRCRTHWGIKGQNINTTIRAEWDRGFVSEVTCSAEDWLAHADALFWSPQQTVGWDIVKKTGCRVCWGNSNRPAPKCPGCKGTGMAQRPCPQTAQPIRRVTFTDSPRGQDWWDVGEGGSTMTADKTHGSWPGVAFTLPPEPV